MSELPRDLNEGSDSITKLWKEVRLETEPDLLKNPEVLSQSVENTKKEIDDKKPRIKEPGNECGDVALRVDLHRDIINDEFGFLDESRNDETKRKRKRRRLDSSTNKPTGEDKKDLSTSKLDSLSIFSKETKKSAREFMQNAQTADLVAMVAIDGGFQRIQLSENQGVGMVTETQCHEDRLRKALGEHHDHTLSKLSIDHSLPLCLLNEDVDSDYVLRLYDPSITEWENDEWVVDWIMLNIQSPHLIFSFFQDPDEVNRFLHNLWYNRIPSFSRLLRSEYTQHWTISMLITMLQSTVHGTFSDYVRNVHFGSDKAAVQKFEGFLGKHLLFTDDIPFERELYEEHLFTMGVVPFLHRPPFKMDLTDIILSLTSIGHAWVSWSFWFGYVLKTVPVSEAKALSDREDCIAYSAIAKCYIMDDLLIPPVHTITKEEPPLSSKAFVEHVKFMFVSLSAYIHWLRIRVIEIFSHDSMDPEHAKVKESLMTIDLLMNYYQTLFKVYETCYTSNPTFYDLRAFSTHVFSHSDHRPDNVSVFDSITPVANLASRLAREAKRIARDGDITESILADINDCLLPIHIEVLYYGRNSGEESNIKAAVKEMLPGSVTTNRTEVLVMREGSTKHLESTIPFDRRWCIDYALQVQALESLINQFVPKFSLNESVILRELEIAETIDFLDESLNDDRSTRWKEKINLANRYVNNRTKNKPEGNESTRPPKRLSFRDEEGGSKDVVIMKIGCIYLVTGGGFSFCTPCFTEAFMAWALIKDAIIGWETVYYKSAITKDKKQVSELQVTELSNFVQRIIFGEFDVDEPGVNHKAKTI